LFLRGRRLFRLRTGNAGDNLVVGLFCGHFFTTAFVLPIFMLTVAGAAPGFEYLVAHHGDHRVVRGTLATRTMIVNVVAKAMCHGVSRIYAKCTLTFTL